MSIAHKHEAEPFPRAQAYGAMAKAIAFIEANAGAPLTLAEIARAAGLSPFALERVFTRWAGLSPLRFKRYLAFRQARARLEGGASVLAAALEAGLSGPARLHDLSVAIAAMTPGELKARGRGLALAYGFHDSPFGIAVVLMSARGVAGLSFADPGEEEAALSDLRARYPQANFRPAQDETAFVAEAVGKAAASVPLHLCGTNLQLKVWEALLSIPPGRKTSYSAVARHAGVPQATRAVANAIGANPVAYLIPCHRVLRKSGALGGYGGGLKRKMAMLAYEEIQDESPSTSAME
jgi:AraC family transcriptional regulator of adaptative response/methylated-DNA-[protein]-cysteine methyltransferase